jgi:hypothetical protein
MGRRERVHTRRAILPRPLGFKTSAVVTVRQHLIDKGIIWSLRHGETAFTVPTFDSFMKRQMPRLERHVPKTLSKGGRQPRRAAKTTGRGE